MVSWYDALVFCNKLSEYEGLTPAYSISGSTEPDDWESQSSAAWDAVEIVSGSTGYRLPAEAQQVVSGERAWSRNGLGSVKNLIRRCNKQKNRQIPIKYST